MIIRFDLGICVMNWKRFVYSAAVAAAITSSISKLNALNMPNTSIRSTEV